MGAFLDVFGGGEDIRPLDPPGNCIICIATPDQAVTKIINTGRTFPPRVGAPNGGRVYVCGDCAKDLGHAMGQVDAAEHDAVVAEHESVSKQLEAADATIASYAALDAALANLTTDLKAVVPADPAPVPAPVQEAPVANTP